MGTSTKRSLEEIHDYSILSVYVVNVVMLLSKRVQKTELKQRLQILIYRTRVSKS